MKSLSYLFIIAGAISILFGAVLLMQRYNPYRLSFLHNSNTKLTSYSTVPTRIKISDLQINVPITTARYVNDEWEISNNSVSYLISSPIPGNKGNSVLYGHNWETILGGLSEAKTGQSLEIEYSNGVKITFVINGIAIVTPDQTHILSETDDTRITLYTCTGFMDRKRLVITAVPQDIKKVSAL